MPKSRRTHYVLAPLLIAICSVAAVVVSGEQTAAAAGNEAADQSLRTFSEIFSTVEQNFADQIEPEDAIYKGAIPGMLRTLDPHSNFFDPRDFQMLKEDQRGAYYGVGMTVGPRNGKTIVIAPFAGSPAYKAGLRPGDVIQKVDDTAVEGLSTTEIADLLRGPRGTKVQVQIGRPGVDDPLFFTITRDEIPRFSVSGGFYLKPGIAYIKVESFNENTSSEMEDKLEALDEQKITGLVLDLRDNPGGLLNEGVAVASHFLKKGDLVVSHHGRSSANRNYSAPYDGSGKDYPVVILVNRYTASAAEIVSGALQDHDRAWILGENTFGKGLVQTVYPMSDNTGLALTTAHYYTPSGRLIQRDYSNISFLDYYTHSDLDEKNLEDVKMTDSGRTVYGGGGITPDQKYEPEPLNDFQLAVARRYALFSFTAQYFGKRDIHLPAGWEPGDDVIAEFHTYLEDNGVQFTEEQFAANRDWIQKELKREMYITAFSDDEAKRVAVEQDPEVQTAIDALPKAQDLLNTAKDLLVQRMNVQETSGAVAR